MIERRSEEHTKKYANQTLRRKNETNRLVKVFPKERRTTQSSVVQGNFNFKRTVNSKVLTMLSKNL